MQLNQAHIIKNMEVNEVQLIKNMELNQGILITDDAMEMGSMQNRLLAIEEKHAKEMETMMTTMQIHFITVEENHVKEMSSMPSHLITMEANLENEMGAIQVNQTNLWRTWKLVKYLFKIDCCPWRESKNDY